MTTPTFQAEWTVHSSLGEHTQGEWSTEQHLTDNAITPLILTLPSTASVQLET